VSSIDGRRARTLALALALLFAAGRASAQETRPSILALDTEAAVDVAVDENGNDATHLFFDAVASARLPAAYASNDGPRELLVTGNRMSRAAN